VITAIPPFIPTAKAADGWTLVYDGRSVKAYPDLREYVWQKNASLPPNGPYDKIGLHRLVKRGATPIGVLFMLAGQAGSGERLISNPPEDNYTKYENFTQAIYWANRGFDVYAIDQRNHFVSKNMPADQLSFMANWGLDQWLSDIREAVDKAKEVSGAEKIFMAGMSIGGGHALWYATKWREDLRGIILLDAYISANTSDPIIAKRGGETNTYNLTKEINDMISAGNWSTQYASLNAMNIARYALENPGAPAQYPPGIPLTPTINPLTGTTWANITEYIAYLIHYSGLHGVGANSNIYGGYGTISADIEHYAYSDRYFPTRIFLEGKAMVDWVNCPYLTYDFDEHYKEIDVPVLAFASGLLANQTGQFRFVNGLNTTDFTGIMLPNYGTWDVTSGTYSVRDVSEPVYQWMLAVIPEFTGPMGFAVTMTVLMVATCAVFLLRRPHLLQHRRPRQS
jgi:pimeloyl-ACP methyl ester carboxylesterase